MQQKILSSPWYFSGRLILFRTYTYGLAALAQRSLVGAVDATTNLWNCIILFGLAMLQIFWEITDGNFDKGRFTKGIFGAG
jgi:hypothetical protein